MYITWQNHTHNEWDTRNSINRPEDASYFKLWFCCWRLKHIQGILSRHTLSTQALESEHKVQTKKNLPKPNDYKPAGENIELIIKSHSDLRTVWILLAILPFTGQFERPRLCPKELCSDGLFQELQWDQTAQNSGTCWNKLKHTRFVSSIKMTNMSPQTVCVPIR